MLNANCTSKTWILWPELLVFYLLDRFLFDAIIVPIAERLFSTCLLFVCLIDDKEVNWRNMFVDEAHSLAQGGEKDFGNFKSK
jgi:hypothetical protein